MRSNTEEAIQLAQSRRTIVEAQDQALRDQYKWMGKIADNTVKKFHDVEVRAISSIQYEPSRVLRISLSAEEVTVTFDEHGFESIPTLRVPVTVFFSNSPIMIAEWARAKTQQEALAHYKRRIKHEQAWMDSLKAQKTKHKQTLKKLKKKKEKMLQISE